MELSNNLNANASIDIQY